MVDEANSSNTRGVSQARGPKRLYLAKCLVVATTTEALLRTLSLPKVCGLLGVGFEQAVSPRQPTPLVADAIARVAWHVDDLYRRLPLPDSCLRRALVAGRLLSAFEPTLVLGVRKSPTFEAHAWLEVAGEILDWSHRHAEFKRL